jgi:hypothetical protein
LIFDLMFLVVARFNTRLINRTRLLAAERKSSADRLIGGGGAFAVWVAQLWLNKISTIFAKG